MRLDGNVLFGIITCLFLGVGSLYLAYVIYERGPEVEYKATITDFNEVHEKGYKIIDQEGKIYRLEKKED